MGTGPAGNMGTGPAGVVGTNGGVAGASGSGVGGPVPAVTASVLMAGAPLVLPTAQPVQTNAGVVNVPPGTVLLTVQAYNDLLGGGSSINPATPAVPKPDCFTGELDVDGKGKALSLVQQLETWLLLVEGWMRTKGYAVGMWTGIAKQYLRGHALLQYTRHCTDNGGVDLPWPTFKEFMRQMVQGTHPTDAQVRAKIKQFRFLDKAIEGPHIPMFGMLLYEFNSLINQLPWTTTGEDKCYYLLDALPPCLTPMLGSDPQTLKPFTDYERMKQQAATLLSIPFYELAQQYKSGRVRDFVQEEESAPKRKKFLTAQAMVNWSDQAYARVWNPEQEVPKEFRFREYQPGCSAWSRGMEKFKSQGCRACGKLGHQIRSCNLKNAMYDEGNFFYYPRDWRERLAKQKASH
jgi:hypothetical protein